ncbi:hypothetical protein KBX53_07700 [Micromonospora sp. M51]|uniref:hypothetical protein n=1 Tax=unclassified Micromonospora TaxID=2617518 RepID=UPI001B378204|nr:MULTISPECIES: hypothetical protein [unclassified Micromonospora]MBQ1010832.1 hypothetical protein [Micromonospora sp. M51]MBQ1034117.1 hypothetical protein [Micromonospora sp. C97]
MARPVTNTAFEGLLLAAGYANSHAAFARQLNHTGRDQGTWRYDAASVYWWLRGRRPGEHVQAAMVETLARKLGRSVAVTELGFGAAEDIGMCIYPASADGAVDASEQIWTRLAKHINQHPSEMFDSGKALQAALGWRYDLPDDTVSRNGRQQVTSTDVQSLYALADHFTDLDRRHGSGSPHTRAVMADFLVRQVTPMLHGTYTDAVGRDLMRAAATLTGQLAFMSYDAGEHAMAQHHVTLGLRLAKAAGDRLYGAHLLANLATQAVFLGHAREAARLIEAAIDGAGRAPAAVLARLHSTAATAYGQSGERRACQLALTRAERALDRTGMDPGPRWVGYFSPAHLAGAAIRCLSDLCLHKQALRHVPDALSLGSQNVRTRALHTALIAMTHARAGDTEAACNWAVKLGQHAVGIQSTRVQRRVDELAATLGPQRESPQVNEVLHALEAMPAAM